MRNENFNLLLEVISLMLLFFLLFSVAGIAIVAFSAIQFELTNTAPKLPEVVTKSFFSPRVYFLHFLVYSIPAALLALTVRAIRLFLMPEPPTGIPSQGPPQTDRHVPP